MVDVSNSHRPDQDVPADRGASDHVRYPTFANARPAGVLDGVPRLHRREVARNRAERDEMVLATGLFARSSVSAYSG